MTDSAFVQFSSLKRQDVNNNSDVRIDIINDSSGDIMIDDNGVITVNRKGVYFISWWCNIQSDNVVITVMRDEDKSVISSSNTTTRVNSIKGNAIVNLKNGERLVIVNDSGGKKTLEPIRSGVSINLCMYLIEGGM